MTPCIEHQGGRTKGGYGTVTVNGRTALAHRKAWTDRFGPVPDGLQLDHLCRNRACVNTDHLEPVTRKENILRGVSFSAVNAAKTHCIHGHPFTVENTYYEKRGRQCRTCRREQPDPTMLERSRRYKARKRLDAEAARGALRPTDLTTETSSERGRRDALRHEAGELALDAEELHPNSEWSGFK